MVGFGTWCRYVKRECTGRADLDPEIAKTLNDEWVSFPTWSEESSFLASKKNVYEEAIFRCEDERFELDIIIEANLATIRCLDMVVKSLEEMTDAEQRTFKFPVHTLGGSSECIHRASVVRLYGDRANDVFAAMERDPLNAIPVVLKRLKQKNVEWRMTQRQWNQIWRELHEKNYLRSLDYQGPSFKRTDPVNFKPKALREKMIEIRDQCVAPNSSPSPFSAGGPTWTRTTVCVAHQSTLATLQVPRVEAGTDGGG